MTVRNKLECLSLAGLFSPSNVCHEGHSLPEWSYFRVFRFRV